MSLDCLRLLCHVVHGSAVTSKLFLSMADLKLLPQLLVIDPTRHLVAGSQVGSRPWAPQRFGATSGAVSLALADGCMLTLSLAGRWTRSSVASSSTP